MQEQLNRMCQVAHRHTGSSGRIEIAPRVSLYSSNARTMPAVGVYHPMLCLILQGAKQVLIGDRVLRYDPASYLVASLELPVSGQIIEASEDKPYICVSLALDCEAIAALVTDLPVAAEGQTTGFAVSAVTPPLLDSWSRMLALLDTPDDAAVLAPMLEREILYRVLRGPQGGILRQIARADSRVSQIRQAIGWIRSNFDRPLRVEHLADIAGMSPASFHRHFKAATAMSPLQYQKMLRLQEARRLLVVSADASRAAYSVGYESASQFSREYSRMFGAPPSRDAERMRGQAIETLQVSNAA
jgi:AraC-like DNA-binding protein